VHDLLVDSGNTRVKWALTGAGVWRSGALTPGADDLSLLLDQAWTALPRPDRVFAAHVGDAARWQALDQWVRRAWRVPLVRVRAQPQLLGVRNGYRDPEQLGADRWAGLIAARALTDGPVSVVGCGTAVTLDALTAAGEFAGGVILPGLFLARASLAHGTAGLQTPPGDAASCLARSTADGIAAGTLYGLAGAIERVLHEFEAVLGAEPTVYITGGDADEIARHIPRALEREPELVLKGLARIAALTRP